jgi:hypothetical protein
MFVVRIFSQQGSTCRPVHFIVWTFKELQQTSILHDLQIPFCVVIGWMMGEEMDLNFQLFETATLFITVLVVAFMLQVCLQNNSAFIMCSVVYKNATEQFSIYAAYEFHQVSPFTF